MSQLTKTEQALVLLAETFFMYAAKSPGGKNDELDMMELQELLNEELKNFSKDSGALNFGEFDRDNDGSVTFVEFMRHLAAVSQKCQSSVRQAAKSGGI